MKDISSNTMPCERSTLKQKQKNPSHEHMPQRWCKHHAHEKEAHPVPHIGNKSRPEYPTTFDVLNQHTPGVANANGGWRG